jgi:DNA processing protein
LDKDREILLDACGFDPISFDVLVERTGFLPESVASLLLLLELDGLVESLPGGHYGRIQQAPG